MKRLPKYRVERKRAGFWEPLFGGRAVAAPSMIGIRIYLRKPRWKILPDDQILFGGSLWRILDMHPVKGMVRLHLDRIATLAGV